MPQKRGSVGAKFRFQVASAYERAKKSSDGEWYCTKCNIPASTEHNNKECHRCSDWGSCERDCTLSKVYCEKCKTEKII
jgi:hypothetical protein